MLQKYLNVSNPEEGPGILNEMPIQKVATRYTSSNAALYFVNITEMLFQFYHQFPQSQDITPT